MSCISRILFKAVFIISIFYFGLGSNIAAYAIDKIKIDAVSNSLPRGGSVMISAIEQYELWRAEPAPEEPVEGASVEGQKAKKDFKYGYAEVVGRAAAHGMLELAVSVYPISFWEIEWARSATSRFYDPAGFDCKTVECRGTVSRGRLTTSLILGAKSFFVKGRLGVMDIENSKSEKDFALEGQGLVVAARGDQIQYSQILAGYTFDPYTLAIVLGDAKTKENKLTSKSTHLVMTQKLDQTWRYMVGFGRFKSDSNFDGNSILIGLHWGAGETLSITGE